MRIAISGAGIAGTTLAYWLARAGHEPVLIEKAPRLRTGGYVIDFWGAGMVVTQRMGLLPQVMAAGYDQREVRFVDDHGRRIGGFDTHTLSELAGGRFTTIGRSTLVEIIFRALNNRVETIFDDQITAIQEHPDGAVVKLEGGATLDVDLVVGADGLHSAVRSLHFGPQAGYERFLGYGVAAFEVPGYQPRDDGVYVIHPAPGHQLARFTMRDDRTLFLLIFETDRDPLADRPSPAQIRDVLRSEFGHLRWETPQILAAMQDADDIYYDRMSQIRMPTWHAGQVALAGDAAAAVSLLAGEGTGLAMIEAYVLAGEISRAGSHHLHAFAEYERRLRRFLAGKQLSAAKFASTFVPHTAAGVWIRNQATKIMGLPGVGNLFLGRSLRDNLDLPDYRR